MSSYRMRYKIGATEYITTVPSDINEKVINKRVVITASQTWTAPYTGWYKFTIKGGGGGGQGSTYGTSVSAFNRSGYAGGEGGTTIGWEKLTAGQTVSVVIGAGGAGGGPTPVSITKGGVGGNGGISTVTVNNTTYTAGGGYAGGGDQGIGIGGSGTIKGQPGETARVVMTSYNNLTAGWTMGGGSVESNFNGVNGGGGCGGAVTGTGNAAGGKGGDGYCWIEYFDPSLED